MVGPGAWFVERQVTERTAGAAAALRPARSAVIAGVSQILPSKKPTHRGSQHGLLIHTGLALSEAPLASERVKGMRIVRVLRRLWTGLFTPSERLYPLSG